MKHSYDEKALAIFNEVNRPGPYDLYGKARYSKLNRLYEILYGRAVFNKTGDVKVRNYELFTMLRISDRQVKRLFRTLEEMGQIKSLYVSYYTGGGVKTERIVRVLAAHAHLNYEYQDRKKVFGAKYRGKGFDYSLIDRVFLVDRGLRWQSHVETEDEPTIPEQFDDPEFINKPGFLESYRGVLDVTETGMGQLEKLKQGVIPAFLYEKYQQWRAGWDECDLHAILMLGGLRAVKKTLSRIRHGVTDESVSGSEAQVSW